MSAAKPVTICDVADLILGREATTGADFEAAGLPMFAGCQGCEASLGCYNAHPSRTGYVRCAQCIGDLGFTTAAEARDFMFPAPVESAKRIADRGPQAVEDAIATALELSDLVLDAEARLAPDEAPAHGARKGREVLVGCDEWHSMVALASALRRAASDG